MRTLNAAAPDFTDALNALLAGRAESQQSIIPIVADIIARVRSEGDAALIELTHKFDQHTLTRLRLDETEWLQCAAQCPGEVADALTLAAKRIEAYSRKQLPEDMIYTEADGTELGWKWSAVDSAGLYVPGGLAAYPSSVLMNAIPAKVAGVKRLVVTVPTPKGILNPVVLKACEIAGVDEIYTIGGAQTIAALAYGTTSIQPVDVICGPGNAYVAEAKRQVYGQVGIDMIAGPSEVLIVADVATPPAWVAMDLLAQAEHDARAQSIVIVEDASYAREIEQAISDALKTLPRANVAASAIEQFGGMIIVEDINRDAPALINRIAPEHLQLMVRDPALIVRDIQHAGAIFIGPYTTEAIGDYIAGPSHVLPTNGTARFASGLSVFSFIKRTSWIHTPKSAFETLATPAIALADAEGLHAHASSMRLRLESGDA